MPLTKRKSQTAVLQGQTGGWMPCMLTWYDPALGGTNSASGAASPHSRTASGEPYDPTKDTCAAPPNYPFGTMLTFSYGGTTVVCRVNDRGGAIQGAHFDLSRSAAQKLGIVNAGVVNAQFQVGSSSGAPPAAAGSGGPPATGSGSSSGSPIQVLSDILTGDISDLATILADAAVTVVKDIGLGVIDWIVIPWWHWNQRAAQSYITDELFSNDESKWTVMPWTAAFWGLGYWLFWTDPDSKSLLKPAPIRNSRAARHVRSLQSLPARTSVIKPKDVKEKTLGKPAPVESRAPVAQTGTMSTTRTLPVKVHGARVNEQDNRSETPIERTGTLPGSKQKVSSNQTSESDSKHRAGSRTSSDSGRSTDRDPGKGSGINGDRA